MYLQFLKIKPVFTEIEYNDIHTIMSDIELQRRVQQIDKNQQELLNKMNDVIAAINLLKDQR